MASALPNPTGCCQETCDSVAENIPGTQGDAGADGADGADGINAFTTLTAGFTQPAAAATVSAEVDDSTWASVGQVVYVQYGGYYEVNAIPDGTHLTLENLDYDGNAVPTTAIPNGASVSPGGLQGPDGAAASGDIDDITPTTTKGDLLVENGSNVTRLGVGTDGRVLHADSGQATGLRWGDVDLSGVNTALDNELPIASGGTGQATRQAAVNALLDSAGSTVGDVAYFNGTNWTRLPKGTSKQLLRTNSGATGLEYATVAVEPQHIDWPGDSYASASGATTLDWANGLTHRINTAGNITVDFSNATAGQDIVLELTVNGADTVGWTPTIKWKGGAEPTPTGGGATDLYWFTYINGTYYGAASLNFS